ncbi:MAG: hypothetical protein E7K72_22750 [Roseomonas mucosa]|nr:hypothetical protein [Roseomonas mucosa]
MIAVMACRSAPAAARRVVLRQRPAAPRFVMAQVAFAPPAIAPVLPIRPVAPRQAVQPARTEAAKPRAAVSDPMQVRDGTPAATALKALGWLLFLSTIAGGGLSALCLLFVIFRGLVA